MRVDAWPGKPGHIWGSDPETMRAQLLDEFAVDYAVLEVLSGQDCYDHPDFAAEWNSAINQWQLDEWLSLDSRLRGTIAVPHEYPSLAVAEIERRAGDERFVAVLLPASTADQLGSPKYWPIYEAATAHGRPVAFHTGGYVDHRGAGYPSFYLDYHVGNGIVMQTQLTSMVAAGMFEEIPGLRVVLTECGVAWAAALIWSLDAGWELMREDHPRLQHRPSEYVREHVWFTTQPIEEPDDPQHLAWALGLRLAQAGAAACAGRVVAPRDPVRERALALRPAARACDRRVTWTRSTAMCNARRSPTTRCFPT
jgi:predicted TIM-barrel fold metal-dependent hydrolase